ICTLAQILGPRKSLQGWDDDLSEMTSRAVPGNEAINGADLESRSGVSFKLYVYDHTP
ncbi:hypothetical protein P7K49_035368, partial [Saguinus oedipus]